MLILAQSVFSAQALHSPNRQRVQSLCGLSLRTHDLWAHPARTTVEKLEIISLLPTRRPINYCRLIAGRRRSSQSHQHNGPELTTTPLASPAMTRFSSHSKAFFSLAASLFNAARTSAPPPPCTRALLSKRRPANQPMAHSSSALRHTASGAAIQAIDEQAGKRGRFFASFGVVMLRASANSLNRLLCFLAFAVWAPQRPLSWFALKHPSSFFASPVSARLLGCVVTVPLALGSTISRFGQVSVRERASEHHPRVDDSERAASPRLIKGNRRDGNPVALLQYYSFSITYAEVGLGRRSRAV